MAGSILHVALNHALPALVVVGLYAYHRSRVVALEADVSFYRGLWGTACRRASEWEEKCRAREAGVESQS